jgi:hypothetical protein
MKFFNIEIRIRKGEDVITRHYITQAEEEVKATAIAHDYFKDYYGEGEKLDEDSYEFDCGCAILEIRNVSETTMEIWQAKRLSERFIISPDSSV